MMKANSTDVFSEYSMNPSIPTPHHLTAVHSSLTSQITNLQVTNSPPPTVLRAAHAVQGAGGNGNDLLPLQPLDLPRSSDMVVRSMTQPVIITFAPVYKNMELVSAMPSRSPCCPTLLVPTPTGRQKLPPATEVTFQSTKRQLM